MAAERADRRAHGFLDDDVYAGLQLAKPQSKQALSRRETPGGDEDWIIERFGGLNLARRATSRWRGAGPHGTHVIDLAAGELNPARIR